jgi:hypothetical protein
MMLLKGLNNLPPDSYFIRLKDNKNAFLHYDGDDPKDKEQVVYKVKEGFIGACIWTKEKAEAFIMQAGIGNVELARVTDVLPNDGSMN